MLPRISIVVPNYNSGPVLERALKSLVDQQYPNLQLIMADSASTDESRQTIDRYREHFDVLICEKDRGQADGLNKGFVRADGDIFGWLCADDELLPGALHHVAEVFAARPEADVVTGNCQRLFPDGSTVIVPGDPDAWNKIHIQNIIEQPATFWRAALHRRVGQLDCTYHLSFDWDFWNRFRRAGAKLIATDRLLCRYYFSADNKTSNAGATFLREATRMLRTYGPLCGGLAYIYRFLYKHFDLHGCYDKPPTCTLARSHAFMWTLAILRTLIGKDLLYRYNWHFAACQQRGLRWW